jgi:hypothetical protein
MVIIFVEAFRYVRMYIYPCCLRTDCTTHQLHSLFAIILAPVYLHADTQPCIYTCLYIANI